MSLLLFCPPKILQQHSAAEWAEALGPDARVLTCASQREALERHLAGRVVCHFFDRFNDNAVVELRALEIARIMPAPRAVGLAEVDMLRAARVNDRLGIATGSEEAMLCYRDKYLMKCRVRDAGLPVAPMALVHSAMDVRRFIDRHGWPVVVKPRDGRGSNNVVVLRDETALDAWLDRQPSSTLYNTMVEGFVDGDHYIVNGLYVRGEPVLISPVRVMTSALDFLGGACHDLHMLDDTNPVQQQLVEYSRRLVEQVLPSEPTMLFHLEAFIDRSDRIVICEIASRLGGVFFNQELHEAWGIDARMTFLRALRDPSLQVPTLEQPVRRVGHISIPPVSGRLLDAPIECALPYVRRYKLYGRPGAAYRGMEFTNAEVVSAIVEGADEAQIRERLQEFQRWFAASTRWETGAVAANAGKAVAAAALPAQ
jgi:biotin carboxylase